MSYFPRNLYPQLDLLGNCIFGVNARNVAEASSRCHFVPPNCAKVTHQKSPEGR